MFDKVPTWMLATFALVLYMIASHMDYQDAVNEQAAVVKECTECLN